MRRFHINEPPQDKTNKMARAPSEDSDQPGHPPSLISLRCLHEESFCPNCHILDYVCTNVYLIKYIQYKFFSNVMTNNRYKLIPNRFINLQSSTHDAQTIKIFISKACKKCLTPHTLCCLTKLVCSRGCRYYNPC